MKQLKLFLTLLALTMGWSNVGAQTDVTSTYITNADFASTDGWTQVHSDQYWSLGNGLIGTYAVANNKASTADDTHLATEYCLGIQCRWSTNFAAFTQTTPTLPVGQYTLTFDVENANTATTSATYENRFMVTVGETTYADENSEWMRGSSSWTTHTITFNVTEESEATISLGYGTGSNNYGTANTPHLYVSHLKLTYFDTEAAEKAALLEAAKNALYGYITKAMTFSNILKDKTLEAAAMTANATMETATDYDAHYNSVVGASETLKAAITTALSQTTLVELVNGNFDTNPNNTLNEDGTTTFGGTLSTSTANPDNTKDMSANTGDHGYLYDVAGWTQYSKFNSTASQGTTSEYGTAMPANGWSTNSTTPPTTDMFGESQGAALHLSAGWNDQARYLQTIDNLPSGRYVFYYEAINQHNNTSIMSNYIGVSGTSGDFYGTTNSFVYSDLKSFPYGSWVIGAFEFNIAKEADINVSVGVTTSSGGSGFGAKLWIDNVLIYRLGDITMTEEQANAILAEVAALDDTPFYAEKKTALANAKAAFEASQTLENYNALNEALIAAKESAQNYELLAKAILNAEIWKHPDTKSTDTLHAKYDNGEYNDETTPDDIYAEYQAAEIAGLKEIAANNYTSAIINPSFETQDMSGWQAEKRNDTGVVMNSLSTYRMDNADGDYIFNSWGGTAENNVYQTIKGLPAGTYQLNAVLAGFEGETLVLAANETTKNIIVDTHKGYGNPVNVIFTLEENCDLTIKASNTKSQSTSDASFIKADNFTLKAYESPLAALKVQYNNLRDEAAFRLTEEVFDVVTGSERSALQALVDSTPEETEEAYQKAIDDLTAALKTFEEASSGYYAFYEAKQIDIPELPYAATKKKETLEDLVNANPNTAEEANSYAEAIPTARRAYYESNAMAEGVEGAIDMTDHITNPNNPTNTNGWTFTAGNFRIMDNQPYTDADGSYLHKYFDSNSWGTAFTTKFVQDVELEPGTYILTAKARGNGTTTYQVIAGEKATDIGNPGNTGDVFGNGWGDYTVEFEVAEGQSATTIGINVETGNSSNWVSFGNFRLVQLSKTDVVMADAADYAALAEAIATAEGNTLGFDAGEYAPYENVAAIEALAAAKAINPEVENSKKVVEEATAALTAATWKANAEEVNAIYDGQFANTEANTTSGDISLPGWTKVQGIRLLVKDEATDPGLAYTDGKAAVFSWGGTTVTYGEQNGYTLPLNAGETYELSFKVSGWRDGDMPTYVTVSLDGAEQSKDITVKPINTPDENPFATVKFYVKPTADNSLLTIYAGKHFTVADLMLKRATVIPGDVNGNMKVDVADVTALVNALQPEAEKPAAADVDGDSDVDADDVKALVELILHNQ